MLKKYNLLIALIIALFSLSACSGQNTEETAVQKDYSGTYVGYSWKGESKEVLLEDAAQKIETKLTIDSKGIITDASMLFFKKDKEGNWYTRQDTKAEVNVDFSKTPTIATLASDNQDYAAGESMFSVKTADMMAFYAVAVDKNGTVALVIVEPYTRYQFEFKMDKDFEYNTKMKDMTIGNGLVVPTVRTSKSGNIKPKSWDEYADYNVLSFYKDPYVLTGQGVFEGLTKKSSIKEFLQRVGVSFEGNRPAEMEVSYGFTGIGGWEGNYQAIADYLIGKNAIKVTSLVDWSNSRYNKNINEDNFFGLDTTSGATKTVQNSADTISGATVRMSRESTSYQRTLVKAGIITEKEVIKGRF
ncbi:hypothetical protein BX659_11738 [Orenia metallireducens]|uniref:Major membrane immunogen, membrane-anchored lipoprotein n=1 Tax=Orenia metallireducens TaxID=1413210 RepID=A0A285HHE2_9FIRM|nr:hypothetical protein [Orenia metallireducens]PRX27173.1 hypothetical protein BX659_11738 [Orenia metallireducens]SNY35118.1 hypothetical protein SAMN06265827_11938 [Orenia metallireducens]